MDDIMVHMAVLEQLYRKWYNLMNPQHISEVLASWQMQYDMDNMRPAPGWKYLHLDYIAPPMDFRTGTLREFIYMDEYMQENDLLHLTALLYRRRSKDTVDAIRRDDQREKLVSRDQVSVWAAILHRYRRHAGVRIMMAGAQVYAVGVKQLVSNLYGSRLFSGEATVNHNMGWMATAMQVAEQGVFGDYEQVLDTTLHEVLSYLVIKKNEADAIERSREQK